MTEAIKRKLNDSKAARWAVLLLVSFTMFCGYYICDVMAPMMDLLKDQFGWTADEYGIFTMSYGWLTAFCLMLIVSGIVLDKLGSRISGIASCLLMIIGCAIKYYAIAHTFTGTIFHLKTQLFIACVGYAIFALGLESSGVIASKVLVRWFNGHEMALAMGIQVSIARIGTALAISSAIPLSHALHSLSAPILIGLMALIIGLLAYLVFCIMDKKLDKTAEIFDDASEEPFRIRDLFFIVRNKGFWLITILCVLFYSAVFPFLKYATSLMINKYGVEPTLAGYIPSILPFGTILLTPIFGTIYDKVGKGATIMIIGSIMLIVIHALFAMPFLNVWWFAAILMVLLGIAFSLVPSALWPSVAHIIPESKVGTAYGLIFWIQNFGLSIVPWMIGKVLHNYCQLDKSTTGASFDYTIPMIIFAAFGVLGVIFAIWLKKEDRKKGYGLELPTVR